MEAMDAIDSMNRELDALEPQLALQALSDGMTRGDGRKAFAPCIVDLNIDTLRPRVVKVRPVWN